MDASIGITTLAIVLVCNALLCQTSHVCYQCPFKWTRHQNHCYRYIYKNLNYEQSKEYCQGQASSRRNGILAPVGSPDEMVFLMWLVGNTTVHTKSIWLDNGLDFPPDEYPSKSYYQSFKSRSVFSNFFTPCQKQRAGVQSSNTSCMVPAPEVVENKCAACTDEGVALNLKDFKSSEDCVSNPDVCDSKSASWSIWLKIKELLIPDDENYAFLSTGGEVMGPNATCVAFFRNGTTNTFVFEVRSKSQSKLWRRSFTESEIPMDVWFHLVATVNLTSSSSNLQTYVNGTLLPDTAETETISTIGSCAKLTVGSGNPYRPWLRSNSSYIPEISASYSNLAVFDGVLTEQEIAGLYECGSLDWNLKVRSLYRDPSYTGSTRYRYICTASVSTGPTISWRLYHASQDQWEDVEQITGIHFNVTETSISPCVVQSALEINRTHWSAAKGDIITCTASAGAVNATVYILQVTSKRFVSYNDHSNIGNEWPPEVELQGIFVAPNNQQFFYMNDGYTNKRTFVCRKKIRWDE